MKKLVGLLLVFILIGSLLMVSAETVRIGSTGETVRAVQSRLKELRYYGGRVDGIFGKATHDAVWGFQRDNRLVADGIAGPRTQAALNLGTGTAPTVQGLTFGAKGDTVRALQALLKNRGYYRDTVDGVYGNSTWTAVWNFERDNKLPADGIADSAVLTLLGMYNQPVIPAPVPGALPSGTTLKFGSSGNAVLALQSALQGRGYYTTSLSGIYDDATWRAVWRYQRDSGLSTDGVAGPATLAKLGLASAVVPSTPAPTGTSLTYGSSGAAVLALQKKLQALGYYSGTPSGSYDDATWKAVWNFQRSNGLAADGIAGSATMAQLGLSTPTAPAAGVPSGSLKYGSKGAAVTALQNSLKQLGYYAGTADGTYGDSTFTAVWWFQKNNSLTPDGIAGTNTIAAINSGYAVRK